MPSANRLLGVALALVCGINALAFAADVTVGGAAMLPSRNILENASNSKDHSTLIRALKTAALDEALIDKGPFTVFAPVNSAFAMLPPETIESLLKPDHKPELVKVLKYHVVAGKLTYDDIEKAIKAGGGEAKLTTLSGGMLVARKNGTHNIIVKDESNGTANISTYDVMQSNGVIHVIDRVLLPN